MNKKIIIIVSIFAVLLLTFIIWNRFYSSNQWSRCTTNDDCAPVQPKAGYSYTCEERQCVSTLVQVAENKQCSTDGDCTAATCCHANEAVNNNFKPNCAGIFCSQECAPNTLDCGQGEIKCTAGACQVRLK